MTPERALEIAKGMKVEADCKSSHIANGTSAICSLCKNKSCLLKQSVITDGVEYSNYIIALIGKEICNAK